MEVLYVTPRLRPGSPALSSLATDTLEENCSEDSAISWHLSGSLTHCLHVQGSFCDQEISLYIICAHSLFKYASLVTNVEC